MRIPFLFLIILFISRLAGNEIWDIANRTADLTSPIEINARLLSDVNRFLANGESKRNDIQSYIMKVAERLYLEPIDHFNPRDIATTYRALAKHINDEMGDSWVTLHLVLESQWLESLRVTEDTVTRKAVIMQLFSDPLDPVVNFRSAAGHTDALGAIEDPVIRSAIWKSLGAVPNISEEQLLRNNVIVPTDGESVRAKTTLVDTYNEVLELTLSAMQSCPWLEPRSDAEWTIITNNQLFERVGLELLTGTDNPRLEQYIAKYKQGHITTALKLCTWLSFHLSATRSEKRCGIGPVESVDMVQQLIPMASTTDDKEELSRAICAFFSNWAHTWREPVVQQRVQRVREPVLELVEWGSAHAPPSPLFLAEFERVRAQLDATSQP